MIQTRYSRAVSWDQGSETCRRNCARRSSTVDKVGNLQRLGLDVLHVQYQLSLYDRARLNELVAAFAGVTAVTWHDAAIPPELEWQRFDLAFTHDEFDAARNRREEPKCGSVRRADRAESFSGRLSAREMEVL